MTTLGVGKGVIRLEAGATAAVQLEFRPRALVLWWCRDHAEGCAGGIGFATDDGRSASTAWAADDALAPGLLSRLGADSAFLLLADPRAPDASSRGHVQFADRSFSLECDRPLEQQWFVHYLAVGGPDVRNATVRSLALESTGTRAVTGLGFSPDVVIAALGAGSMAGGPRSGLTVGFGAAGRGSGQAAGGFASQAETGGTIARGAQRTDALAVLPVPAASGGIATLSRLASFDRDGFTLETTRLASELPLAVLALDGGSYSVGSGSASSRATAVGFSPVGALIFGTGLSATPHARDIGRLCLGGFSDDRRVGCISWSTLRRGAWPPEPRSRSTHDAVFDVIDTTSGELHASAALAAVGRRRFSLDWPVWDRAPRDFGYVAFGSERRGRPLRERLRLLGQGGPLRE